MKVGTTARKIEVADEPTLVDIARQCSSIQLPQILKQLTPDRRLALVVAHLQERMPGKEGLQAIAKELTPVERGRILSIAGAAKPALLEAGFQEHMEAPLRSSSTEDRARLLAQAKVGLPPLLASFITKYDFAPRIADVRKGRCGLTAAEKSDVRIQLNDLDAAQLKQLRELLVERPPHPQLKKMRGHWAISGPPSLAAVLSILSGEPLGLLPDTTKELKRRAKEVINVLMMGPPDPIKESWVEHLCQSDLALTFVEGAGHGALRVLSHIDLPTFEAACGTEWGRQYVLVTAHDSAKHGELDAWVKKHGATELGDALEALERLSWHGPFLDTAQLIKQLGFDGAVKLATLLDDSSIQHGLRALRVLRGQETEPLVRSLVGKSEAEIKTLCADATRAVPEFGAAGAPLFSGGRWPPIEFPRTKKLINAETKLFGTSAIGPAERKTMPSAQLSWMANMLRYEIGQRDPGLLIQLDRELEGRRFVSFRYYDELYKKGISNPEHRYSVETFNSWKSADSLVAKRAQETRGRPLKEGELIALMKELHVLVGRGMIDIGESHMEERDLGRIRTEAEDHVQLGFGFQRVGENTARILAKNPYLQSFLPLENSMPDEEGKYLRFVAFSEGTKVPEHVRGLDEFVRKHEGHMLPDALAAEIHFRMVSIHPFMDGNGRTSKLIADFILARAGIRPPVWREGDVMKHQDRWPDAVRTGVEYDLATVERYYFQMIEGKRS